MFPCCFVGIGDYQPQTVLPETRQDEVLYLKRLLTINITFILNKIFGIFLSGGNSPTRGDTEEQVEFGERLAEDEDEEKGWNI
jgi:hypothetical protein